MIDIGAYLLCLVAMGIIGILVAIILGVMEALLCVPLE